MATPVKKGQVHPVLAAIVIIAVLAAVGVIYWYGARPPAIPKGSGGPKKKFSWKKLAGETWLGDENAAIKIQGFFRPNSGKAAQDSLKALQAQYPRQVHLYMGSPSMGVGQNLKAKDGQIYVNGKLVAENGDAEAVKKAVEGQLGAPKP